MYKIVIVDDEGKTTVIPFSRSTFSIGRAPSSAIRLTDRDVSRKHATMYRLHHETFAIEDHGSRTGTHVDGTRVDDGLCTVNLEERIRIGGYQLFVSQRKIPGMPLGIQVDPKKEKGVGKVTPHPRFVMLEGPTPGREIDLTGELYIIGRSDRANVHIEDQSISRAHARLEETGGHWVISDLDSINGIHVNGIRKDDYVLKAGDIVDFGKIVFRYVAPGESYDYESACQATDEDIETKKNKRFALFTGLALTMMVALLVTWLQMRDDGIRNDGVHSPSADEPELSFDNLMAAGDAAATSHRWESAAAYYAKAIALRPTHEAARTKKAAATTEMEAHAAIATAQRAMRENKAELAMTELIRLPADSRHYNANTVRDLATQLCEEFLYRIEFMITSGDPKAAPLLGKLGRLPDASAACLDKRNQLQALLRQQEDIADAPKLPADVGGVRPVNDRPSRERPVAPLPLRIDTATATTDTAASTTPAHETRPVAAPAHPVAPSPVQNDTSTTE